MLQEYRAEIDKIDQEILELLNQRFVITKKIGEFKKQQQIQVLDTNRWQAVLARLQELSLEKSDLDPDMVAEIWEVIHKYSVAGQIDKKL